MAAKPIKSLELHCTMIQFFIKRLIQADLEKSGFLNVGVYCIARSPGFHCPGVLTIYANHPDGTFRYKYEMI